LTNIFVQAIRPKHYEVEIDLEILDSLLKKKM